MPGRDGKGPLGEGPMTGGGFGYCASENINVAPYPRRGCGRCYSGRGLGRGKGYRNRYLAYNAPVLRAESNVNEKQFLEVELKHLQVEIDNIKSRLDTLNMDGGKS